MPCAKVEARKEFPGHAIVVLSAMMMYLSSVGLRSLHFSWFFTPDETRHGIAGYIHTVALRSSVLITAVVVP